MLPNDSGETNGEKKLKGQNFFADAKRYMAIQTGVYLYNLSLGESCSSLKLKVLESDNLKTTLTIVR